MLLATVAGTSANAQDTTSAVARYTSAVSAMRTLEDPAYLSYRSSWSGTTHFQFVQAGSHIGLSVGTGSNFTFAHTYAISYRHADRAVALNEDKHDRIVGYQTHLFDPTWDGAYSMLRYGISGQPAATPPAPAAAPEPAPAASTQPQTIGVVTAISAAFYRVEDRGARSCANGDAGYALALTALSDPRAHPLTNVTIDANNGRFCDMQFRLKNPGVVGETGTVDLHFMQSGNAWLVSGGTVDVSVRVFGISAKHVTITWANTNFTAPQTIPDAAFTSPTSS